MSTLTEIDRSIRTVLASLAAGASLDDALEIVSAAIVERTHSPACRIWLVKPGDLCATCPLVDRCADRSMCLHFKTSAPDASDGPVRVPLTVFRDRVAARGGSARIGDPSGLGRMLFPSTEVTASAAFAAFPLKGPAGVLGLLAVQRRTPYSHEEVEELRAFADLTVLAVRVADLTSRLQRASYQIGETAETRVEVESLLHAILSGSPEHAVIAEDLQGNITVFGQGARNLYGYEPEEMIGKVKSDVLFAPEEVESGKIVEILNEVMHTGRCESVITRIRKNGDRFPSRATITVRRDPDGDPAGFVIVERDLTKERDTAKLGETSARQVAQLEDTVVALKSANALLEREVGVLRRQSADLASRAAHAFDADDVTAIRIATIRELKAQVAALQAELLEITRERDVLLARSAPPAGVPATATPAEIRKSRVLVVDDDPVSRGDLSSMLEHPSLDVVVASNWSEAEFGLRPKLPDALVINLGIPGTDGVSVVRFLATQPSLSRLGFVLITTKDLTSADRRALGPSTSVLLQGTFGREELLAAVDRAVTKWQSQS